MGYSQKFYSILSKCKILESRGNIIRFTGNGEGDSSGIKKTVIFNSECLYVVVRYSCTHQRKTLHDQEETLKETKRIFIPQRVHARSHADLSSSVDEIFCRINDPRASKSFDRPIDRDQRRGLPGSKGTWPIAREGKKRETHGRLVPAVSRRSRHQRGHS